MEKPSSSNRKLRNKILKLFPKAISFQNLPFSPRRDSRSDVRPRAGHNKAFSGPIVHMIPAEARRKPKSFETQEPTSPKVSCTGRVNCKSKISKKTKHVSLPREFKPAPLVQQAERTEPAGPVKKKKAGIKRLLRKSREPAGRAEPVGGSAPSLNHMRKFASSRETFANFDWTTAQVAPEYSSDEEDGGGIPFSEPLFLTRGGGRGGGLELEPKKEINLWKRRTMAHQPKSLELDLDE